MKLQQLRYIVEVARRGMNVSEAAEALYTSQPGVSKQIKLLEDELGVMIFERSGKRFTGVTEPGRSIIESAERILREAENLKRLGRDYSGGDTGTLIVAATHTQARYALPPAVKDFVTMHPKVQLTLHQGTPAQIADWVEKGDADIGIATESLESHPGLVTLPVRQWSHCVIAPAGHPVLHSQPLSLAELARWPLITYDSAFTGRSGINRAFQRQGLEPQVVLTALDADVIKTYVTLGLGLGIIAALAFDKERDAGLEALEAGHLFESNTTRLALRRGVFLRRFEYDFITLFAPHLDRRAVERVLQGGGDAYQL
ncbi:CysB family HTH-type transcriptional regulator [Azovibrio restrictus]|uniref:CysB family HTH-type transcriptional regulator n=1 Tax=Azovibrio restrictus TaxID=146938 RepID=UPI00041F8ABE|nr:CysB family HTH-type transcriptional regulator [Azovibrio restrictus]